MNFCFIIFLNLVMANSAKYIIAYYKIIINLFYHNIGRLSKKKLKFIAVKMGVDNIYSIKSLPVFQFFLKSQTSLGVPPKIIDDKNQIILFLL